VTFCEFIKLGDREAEKQKETGSGASGFFNKESLFELNRCVGEVERMMKLLIILIENKHLNPVPPWRD